MGLWQRLFGEFVDVITWEEGDIKTMVWQFPREGNAIKWGAQLIVREGQQAVFVLEGRVADTFGPGRYRLETRNLPIITSLLATPTALQSPFKADIFFTSSRQFTDLKWGTRHPVIIRDPEFGPVRIRGFGTYSMRIQNSVQLIRELSGSNSHFSVEDIENQLRNLIASRLADCLGEEQLSLVELSSNYDELGDKLAKAMAKDWAQYGLEITSMLIENLTAPPEVEKALDRRSSIEITGDLEAFRTYQEGIALEKAAENPGGTAAAGAGMAMGFELGNRIPPPPPPPPPPPSNKAQSATSDETSPEDKGKSE